MQGVRSFKISFYQMVMLLMLICASGCSVGAENSLMDASLLRRSHSISGRASSRIVNDISNEMKGGNYEGPPIDVVQDENGQMYIVDGHHRAAAARVTGTKVEVNIVHDIENHPSSYESIEEIINDSFSVGRDKLRPMK